MRLMKLSEAGGSWSRWLALMFILPKYKHENTKALSNTVSLSWICRMWALWRRCSFSSSAPPSSPLPPSAESSQAEHGPDTAQCGGGRGSPLRSHLHYGAWSSLSCSSFSNINDLYIFINLINRLKLFMSRENNKKCLQMVDTGAAQLWHKPNGDFSDKYCVGLHILHI